MGNQDLSSVVAEGAAKVDRHFHSVWAVKGHCVQLEEVIIFPSLTLSFFESASQILSDSLSQGRTKM